MKRDLSTTEVGQICAVSGQTVSRLIDSNELMGYRIPGSKFRRVPRSVLAEFLLANALPTERFKARFPELVLDQAS